MRKQLTRLIVGLIALGLLVGIMWIADQVNVHGSTAIMVCVFGWAVGFAITEVLP